MHRRHAASNKGRIQLLKVGCRSTIREFKFKDVAYVLNRSVQYNINEHWVSVSERWLLVKMVGNFLWLDGPSFGRGSRERHKQGSYEVQ